MPATVVEALDMFLLYILCSLYLVLTRAYDKGSHNVDMQIESFQFKDYYFNFYNVEANWDEAFAICKAAYSRLAVVHSMERANFLAETLTHTVVGFEDVWIGGRILIDNWEWVAVRHPLPLEVLDGYPPWLNFPTQRGRYCLSLDRVNHSKPIFVELECSLQRPFICEKSAVEHLMDIPMPLPQTKLGKSSFSIYYGRVTWDEALTFCKQSGSRLATIPNMETAKQLVIIMQRSRPPIKSAWLGARKQSYGWIWVATDEMLPTEKDLETEFPPWANDHVLDRYAFRDCITLDHQICRNVDFRSCEEKPIFVRESCNLKKDFICETVPPAKRDSNGTELVMLDSIKYIFSRERRSWYSAFKLCNSLNMELAMPASRRELINIVSNLADVQYAWDHIWLGAKWNVLKNEWEWLNNTIPQPFSNNSYLPWCKSTSVHEDYENCLNLDRDAHNSPVVYGFNCSEQQGFVCQFISEDELPSALHRKQMHNFLVHDYLLNHANAEEACLFNKSHLAIVNTIELAKQLSLMLPLDTLVWLGGERVDSIWQWSATKEVIPDFPNSDNYPPWGALITREGKVCLAMQAGYQKFPEFVEMPCNSKLFYVCELRQEDLPEPAVTVEHNDLSFSFFAQQESWDKADVICASTQMRLPKIGNQVLANFLAGVTEENKIWWVGAKRDPNGNWIWTSSGEKIPNKIINSSWFGVNNTFNKSESECLILMDDTHTPMFSGKKCSEKYEFICVNDKMQNKDLIINKNNITIGIAQYLTNFENGKKYCLEKEMVPMNLTHDVKMTKEIMDERNIESVWMNIIHTNEGRWIYINNYQEFSTGVKFPDKNRKYEHGSTKKDCAMLVRKVTGQLEIRRSDCNDFSFMMCTRGIINTTAIFEEVDDHLYNNVTITANVEGRTFNESKQFCKEIGGDLIEWTLYEDAVGFFKKLSAEYKSFWIGEHQARKTLSDSNSTHPTDYNKYKQIKQQQQNLCLAYNKLNDSYHNVACNAKLSTLCFLEIRSCNTVPKIPDLRWIPQRCANDELASGRVCTAKCKSGILFGPHKIVCIKGNWTYRSDPTITPACMSNIKQSEFLLKLLTSEIVIVSRPRPDFIFMLDAGVSNFIFDLSVAMIKHIINIILLGEGRKAALILYSRQIHIALDFHEYNTCDFTEKLKYLALRDRASFPSYFKTLEIVEHMINATDNRIFLIFFAIRKDAGPVVERNELIKKLQERGVIVVVLAVGNKMDRIGLERMASIHNHQLQLYLFPNSSTFLECANYLHRHKSIAVNTCATEQKTYRLASSGISSNNGH